MKKSKRKALGQHFLTDKNILKKIIETINPKKEDLIIEIGAGKGQLTFPLAQRSQEVIAIEKDKSFIPFLKSKAFPNLIILEMDVLKVDFHELVKKENPKLVGNLPYSISSPVLFKVLANKELFSDCIFLLQKQVAERVCAVPGSKKYAPLSILFQNYFSANLHFIVLPGAFSPPPQVESALISLKRKEQPDFFVQNEEHFKRFLKGAFQHRRKTLLNNLKRFHFLSSQVKEALQRCGIHQDVRPEEVSLSQYVALYDYLYFRMPFSP